MLNDGFPMRALNIVKLLASRIRPGGVVLTDDVGGFRGIAKTISPICEIAPTASIPC
ncbi:MAG: hypothetical protein NTAFB05_00210 [Nitrobacter sp.]|uniref:hypothetical protein n=1 Tax=Nitrobacter sp. TaxID=29420 RepID=UPI00387DF7FF